MQRLSISALLAMAFTFLISACNSSTSPTDSGSGPELSKGSYFITDDRDDLYKYEQYFVIQSGHRWEFVEYGYLPSSKSLCQISRQMGTYTATDTSMTLTVKSGGNAEGKCGMTLADFKAIPLENAPSGLSETFMIRNVTESGFEGRDFFKGIEPGWVLYSKKSDPYGFY